MKTEFKAINSRRVIIIDDNPAIHEDFRKILVPDGGSNDMLEAAEALFGEAIEVAAKIDVDLAHARQGEEGLAMCKEAISNGKPFAVAFVDMRMPPGWDGLKTISELWKVDPNLQVVICSAYSDHSWSQIRESVGNTDRLLILKKPFDNAEVLQLTMALIEKRFLTEVAETRAEELEAIVEERTSHMREAKRETDLLLSAIDSMLIGLDQEGRVNLWNSQSEISFGIKSSETLGQVFSKLPIQWEDSSKIEQNVAKNGKRFEAVFHNKEGEHRIVGMSSFPVSDEGVRKGSLIIGTDITEHRALESQLVQAQKLESVGQLAAGVAHEINTPMQYLGDNLDFLEKKVGLLTPVIAGLQQVLSSDGEEREDALSNLETAATKIKANKFVDGLLDAIADSRDGVHHVSKIVRAMKEFAHPGQEEKISVDINRALKSTIAVSTNEWKYVAEIETNFDDSSPTVLAFPVELNQVFLNILVNAAHAVSDVTEGGANGKGKITVSTKLVDDAVQVSISDSGAGIPDDIKTRIFDPFFTTKEVGKGTGQGLSIAHSVIVKKHGGRLLCESTLGEGTNFLIEIPTKSDGNEDVSSDIKSNSEQTATS